MDAPTVPDAPAMCESFGNSRVAAIASVATTMMKAIFAILGISASP
jgi:hypothetical protein